MPSKWTDFHTALHARIAEREAGAGGKLSSRKKQRTVKRTFKKSKRRR